jgi:hypothetical protein
VPRVDIHTHLFPDEVLSRLPAGLRADSYPERDQVGLQVEGGPSAGRGAPAAGAAPSPAAGANFRASLARH